MRTRMSTIVAPDGPAITGLQSSSAHRREIVGERADPPQYVLDRVDVGSRSAAMPGQHAGAS